ncbi:hypothetical protein B0H19DRAFT_1243020 [Mycena capillaripes]|nr:hypothetical protein B0H19DRAFT_1243020 [Mycena capillaripes]
MLSFLLLFSLLPPIADLRTLFFIYSGRGPRDGPLGRDEGTLRARRGWRMRPLWIRHAWGSGACRDTSALLRPVLATLLASPRNSPRWARSCATPTFWSSRDDEFKFRDRAKAHHRGRC